MCSLIGSHRKSHCVFAHHQQPITSHNHSSFSWWHILVTAASKAPLISFALQVPQGTASQIIPSRSSFYWHSGKLDCCCLPPRVAVNELAAAATAVHSPAVSGTAASHWPVTLSRGVLMDCVGHWLLIPPDVGTGCKYCAGELYFNQQRYWSPAAASPNNSVIFFLWICCWWEKKMVPGNLC